MFLFSIGENGQTFILGGHLFVTRIKWVLEEKGKERR